MLVLKCFKIVLIYWCFKVLNRCSRGFFFRSVKSFCICIEHKKLCNCHSSFFFFLSFFLVQFSGWTAKKNFSNILSIDNHEACDQDQTYFIVHIKKKKVCITNVFQDVFEMCVIHVMSYALPIHHNQLSQQPKNYKNQKLRNKMEGDT